MLDAHPAVPLVELLEEIGIDLEKVQGRGIGQRGRFHEAEKQKEIVQLRGLLAKIVFVATECNAVHELAEAAAEHREFVGPIHSLIISRTVYS